METVMFFGYFVLVKYVLLTVADYKASFGEDHQHWWTYGKPLQDALVWASYCVGRPEKAFHGHDVYGDSVVFSNGKEAYHYLLTLCAIESGADLFFDMNDPGQAKLFIITLGKMIKRNMLDWSFSKAFQTLFYESPKERIDTLMRNRGYEIEYRLSKIRRENYDNFVLCKQIDEIEFLFNLPHK